MEIKSTLKKPYTDEQRIAFIVEENHHKGYEIKETEKALEAWGLTAAEIEKKEHREKIQEQINSWEAELTPRNIRAAFLGDEYALTKIQRIEEHIAELRKQLDQLEGA